MTETSAKIFINSLPKAGTNLLIKLAKLLNYQLRYPAVIGRYGWKSILEYPITHAWNNINSISIGVDMPRSVRVGYIKSIFSRLQPGQFAFGHFPYSDHGRYLLQKYNIKSLLILRDPRDVVVSHAFYVSKNKNHPLYPFYTHTLKDFKTQLNFSITGGQAGNIYLESIGSRLKSMCGWLKCDTVHTVRFENLIGTQGGGQDRLQRESIEALCMFLGAPISEQEINAIISNLFGGTPTFRKGQIGSWQEYFDEKINSTFMINTNDAMATLGYNQ